MQSAHVARRKPGDAARIMAQQRAAAAAAAAKASDKEAALVGGRSHAVWPVKGPYTGPKTKTNLGKAMKAMENLSFRTLFLCFSLLLSAYVLDFH